MACFFLKSGKNTAFHTAGKSKTDMPFPRLYSRPIQAIGRLEFCQETSIPGLAKSGGNVNKIFTKKRAVFLAFSF